MLSMAALSLSACAAPSIGSSAEYSPRSSFSQELHDALPSEVRKSESISVVGEVNGPWRVVDDDENISGFQTDLLEELSIILGVELEASLASGLPAVKLGLQSQRHDVAFGPLLSSEATQKDLLFIDYALGRPAFVYLSDSDPVESLTDLCGKTVAVIEGSAAFDPLLEKMDSGCTDAGQEKVGVLSQSDTNASLVAVQSDRADAVATAGHRAIYFESVNPGKFDSYITTDDDIIPDRLGMAFDPANQELAEVMHAAWQQVYDSGVYDDLVERYNLGASAVEELSFHDSAAEAK